MSTPRATLGLTTWLGRRLVPSMLLVLSAAAAIGLLRRHVLFLPGIMGMLAGGLTGGLSGRLGRGDPEAAWSFTHRGWLALGAGLLYGVATASVVSVLSAGLMDLPLDWLIDVIAGHQGELFAGSSKTSLQRVGGQLSGSWWLIFAAVDALLFSFLFLVTSAAGWASAKVPLDPPSHEIPTDGEISPPPLDPGRSAPPLPLLSLGACAAASVALLVGLSQWPAFSRSSRTDASASQIIAELQGSWIFDERAGFLGPTEADRCFTVSYGLGNELAGFSTNPATFMLSLAGRRDGIFEGRLHIRGRNTLSVRMRPSDDRSTLDFVVDWSGAGGRAEKQLSARRVDLPP